MDGLSIGLTVVIAAAAVAQAVFAGLLWWTLVRKRTSVGATFELRRPDPNKPQQAWIRIENSSAVGIEHTHLVLYLTAKTRNFGPGTIDLRVSIAPWGWREVEITNDFIAMAMRIDSADPAWNGAAHSVDVILKPHYKVEGKAKMGRNANYQVEFSGQNFQSARLTLEHEGHIMPL